MIWRGLGGMAAWAALSTSCLAAEAVRLDVADAIQQGVSDQPVTITAWAVRGELVADPLDRYAWEERYNDPSSSGRRLGYRGGAAEWRVDEAKAQRVTVTGRVQRCSGEGGGNLLAAIGVDDEFCAQRRGLYLEIERAEAGEAVPLVRGLTQDAAGRGNLLPLAADSPVRASVAAWFIAEVGGLEALADNLALEVFGWRRPLWADEEVAAAWQQIGAVAPEAVVCVMDQALAEQGRWPISTKDIGNTKDRPYLCAQIMSTGGKRRAVFAEDPSPAMEPR